MKTLHKNNQKAIAQWTAKDYADAYRDYVSNWCNAEHWFSSLMPEAATMDQVLDFRDICERFHVMGF